MKLVKHDASKNRPLLRHVVSDAFIQKYGRIIAHKKAVYAHNELDMLQSSPSETTAVSAAKPQAKALLFY